MVQPFVPFQQRVAFGGQLRVTASRSVMSAITIARSTSISSGRLELAAGSISIAHESYAAAEGL